MIRLAAREGRNDFSNTVNRVRYNRERVVLQRHGKDCVAVIPLEDLALLEALEDTEDAKALKRAIAEARRKGEKGTPVRKIGRRLGLE